MWGSIKGDLFKRVHLQGIHPSRGLLRDLFKGSVQGGGSIKVGSNKMCPSKGSV